MSPPAQEPEVPAVPRHVLPTLRSNTLCVEHVRMLPEPCSNAVPCPRAPSVALSERAGYLALRVTGSKAAVPRPFLPCTEGLEVCGRLDLWSGCSCD